MKANHKATTNCANPAIYVGTYKKYNNGNLGGQWIDITTFDSYKELIKYCIQLHKDEVSPKTDVYINLRDALNDLEEIKKIQQAINTLVWLDEKPELYTWKYKYVTAKTEWINITMRMTKLRVNSIL